MIIKEYRIVLPIKLSDFEVAHLHTVAKMSKDETGRGEGIEVIENKPFMKKGEKGQYTKKIFHFDSRIPPFIRAFFSKDLLQINEDSWKTFPDSKTILSNDYIKDKFDITIKTKYLADSGESENVHQLASNEWKATEVVHIDIANDYVARKDYSEDTDPKLFQSTKTRLINLDEDWIAKLGSNDENANFMCAYKLVSCNFKYWPIQSQVEKLIHKNQKIFFTKFHRALYCSLDSWFDLELEDMRKIEKETEEDLKDLMKK